jgi:CRP-like cAMP-binding protein
VIFTFLRPSEENALLRASTERALEPEQVIFEQNEKLRTIFLISDGLVRIEQQQGEQSLLVAILGAGEFFGEMSFVDGAPTSARAVAQEVSHLRVIDSAQIDRLSAEDPTFDGRLYRSLAAILVKRLRKSSLLLSLENRQV